MAKLIMLTTLEVAKYPDDQRWVDAQDFLNFLTEGSNMKYFTSPQIVDIGGTRFRWLKVEAVENAYIHPNAVRR